MVRRLRLICTVVEFAVVTNINLGNNFFLSFFLFIMEFKIAVELTSSLFFFLMELIFLNGHKSVNGQVLDQRNSENWILAKRRIETKL
jgi:hypothetical protein